MVMTTYLVYGGDEDTFQIFSGFKKKQRNTSKIFSMEPTTAD
jgi:hypothetical protein